jgi:hypothetical protein
MLPDDTGRRTILTEVAERLISARVRLGYDLDAAAAAAHILPERLAEAEDAAIALREDELQALADAYGVDPASFFGGRVTPFSYLAGA